MANTKKIQIIVDRQNCIGADSCEVLAPEYFKLATDGKIDLVGGTQSGGKWTCELEVDEKELKKLKQAATSCPVQVIEIIEK